MKNLRIYSLMLAAALLSACGGSGSSAGRQDAVSEDYQGVWLAPAYGQGIVIGKSQAETFNYTRDYCLLDEADTGIDDADIESLYRLSDGALVFFADVGIAEFHAPAITFQRADHLPDACTEGYTPQLGQGDYRRDPQRDLAVFQQIFDQYSISIARQGVDWQALSLEAQAMVEGETTDETLLAIMGQMITPLADIHTSVSFLDTRFRFSNKPFLAELLRDEFVAQNNLTLPLDAATQERAFDYIVEQASINQSLPLSYAESEAAINTAADNTITWFINNNVGYLHISAMGGFSRESDDNAAELTALNQALDLILTAMQDTDGLVIDIRTNTGGSDFLALAIVSRFVANPVLVYRKQAGSASQLTELVDVVVSPPGAIQYHKPIALLTSASTVSAGEVFALAMSSLEQVVVIGEATQGAFSDTLEKRLPNGFAIELSNERYLSVEGEWLEGLGVPVDIPTPVFTLAERLEETDLALEAAIRYLLDL